MFEGPLWPEAVDLVMVAPGTKGLPLLRDRELGRALEGVEVFLEAREAHDCEDCGPPLEAGDPISLFGLSIGSIG